MTMTSEVTSGSKTEIPEAERPDSEESVDFEDPRDEDESKKVFDEKNVISDF